MTILVLADANADLSAVIPRFPNEGDDSQITELGWGSGGCGVNVAAALALLGAPARLLARIGRDPAADIALRAARAAGADLSAIQVDHTLATGLCIAAVSPNSERTFFSYRGANVAWDYQVRDTTIFNNVRWLHISGYSLLEGHQRASALALIEAATQRTIPISLDLCLPQLRAWRNETLDLLPRLRILFTNEPELATLTASDSEQDDAIGSRMIDKLLARGVDMVAIKLGARGCMIAHDNAYHNVPAFPISALDTNGCGDAFVAGFLYAYTRGVPIAECATLANAIAALKATRYGSASALPTRAELHTFLHKHNITFTKGGFNYDPALETAS